jgi:hypothetical protein
MLASLLAGSLIAYAAVSLHESGLAPAAGAIVLAVSNAGGVAARLGSGWWAQRRHSTSLRIVSVMMIAGAVGAFLLSFETPTTAAIGSVVAFTLGWGWSALLFAVILEVNLDNPGATGAVLQSGSMAGSGAGPLLMACLVGSFGLTAGWIVVGGAGLIAGLLILRDKSPGPTRA